MPREFRPKIFSQHDDNGPPKSVNCPVPPSPSVYWNHRDGRKPRSNPRAPITCRQNLYNKRLMGASFPNSEFARLCDHGLIRGGAQGQMSQRRLVDSGLLSHVYLFYLLSFVFYLLFILALARRFPLRVEMRFSQNQVPLHASLIAPRVEHLPPFPGSRGTWAQAHIRRQSSRRR
jgi:hypothetical protein